MKKKQYTLIAVMVMIVALLGTACSETSEAGMWPIGMESGVCDGAGDFTWGMSYDEVAAMEGAVHHDEGELIFEEVEFGGVSGQVRCTFAEDGLRALVYVLEGDEAYEDYKRICDDFIAAYGQPSDSVNVEYVEETGTSWPKELWMQGVPTSDGGETYVSLESKFKKGWIVVTLLKK